MEPADLLERLESDGWAAIEAIETAELDELTRALGKTTVTRLKARDGERTSRLSLSSMHGRDEFPPHTDGAAKAMPPRFVAIRSERRYRAATLLYDGEEEALRSPLFSRSWLVDGGAQAFYAVPRRQVEGKVVWRLNSDVMRPVDPSIEAKAAMEPFGTMAKVRVEWEPGLAVVWDNRRMLHAREAVGPDDGRRELMRISIA